MEKEEGTLAPSVFLISLIFKDANIHNISEYPNFFNATI